MIRNILIIRFRRVGDSVLSMALCHSLKLSFPEAKIHFVINEAIAPLYVGHPDVDVVIPFSPEECKGLKYLRKVRAVVSCTHFDAIIDMRSTIKTLPFCLFSLSTPYRIGRWKSYNRGVHNYRLRSPEGANRVETNLNLMKPLAKEGTLVKDEHFPLYVTEKERLNYRTYMEQQGIDFSRPVILAAVVTRLTYKAWPQERMTDVLRKIIEAFPNVQIVFNYAGAVEAEAARALHASLHNDAHVMLNIEAKNLRELCALCCNSDFFFGNEGGPRHISQAFEIPSFAIYPPGIDKAFWLPASADKFQGISPDEFLSAETQRTMSYAERFDPITSEHVWERMLPMLNHFISKKL